MLKTILDGLAIFGPIAIIGYVELVAIPGLIAKAMGPREWGPYAIALHVVMVLLLMLLSAGAGAWISRKSVFAVNEQLTSVYLGPVIKAIENLTTGKWHADSMVAQEGLKQGAKFGYAAGKAATGESIDRGQFLAGLGDLEVPSAQIAGESAEVIGDFKSYMDNLAQKKSRLS